MKFQWLNESAMEQQDGKIVITAPEKSDFFCAMGEGGQLSVSVSNAPFYYTEIEGDFVLRVKASLEFKDTYDSACIMVMKDTSLWAKACLEYTDFGTHAVVSVVNNIASDDANGCNVEGNAAWLKMCRVGDNFSLHYSLDGEHFSMMRYFYLPVGPIAKVGLLAQAPTGKGGQRIFEHLSIENVTVQNLRAGK